MFKLAEAQGGRRSIGEKHRQGTAIVGMPAQLVEQECSLVVITRTDQLDRLFVDEKVSQAAATHPKYPIRTRAAPATK